MTVNIKKAAMFDLDGTLVNSMWVWENLMTDFIEKHSLTVSEEILDNVSHMSLVQSSAYIKEELNMSMNADEIRSEWKEMVYDSYANDIFLKEGVKEYLKKIKTDGKKLAIATACESGLCEACLKNNGIYELFDVFTYADDVGKSKTSPDIYLECIRRLGCTVEEVTLFEDILVGIKTAKSVGIEVVAVEDEDSIDDRPRIIATADYYIKSFNELL